MSAVALQAFWHSSAHVLGEALEQMYGVDLTIGPTIDEGFYYDCYMGEGRGTLTQVCTLAHGRLARSFATRLATYTRSGSARACAPRHVCPATGRAIHCT